MSTLTPLTALASRIKTLQSAVRDLTSEYQQWLEVAEVFQAGLAETLEKLECVSDDLWGIDIDPPRSDEILV